MPGGKGPAAEEEMALPLVAFPMPISSTELGGGEKRRVCVRTNVLVCKMFSPKNLAQIGAFYSK
jgi:hypothetical protein